jgi:DNA-binding transcriptional MerR regulator
LECSPRFTVGLVTTSEAKRGAIGVSALAERVGVARDTIRYYEKVGLLPAPNRSASDYRQYDETAVDRLRFIQGCQRLGLRLREIKTLLEVRDTRHMPLRTGRGAAPAATP